MEVCLVGPPTVTEFDPQTASSEAFRLIAEHVPLGILTLAAVLEERDFSPTVIDLNREYSEFLRSPSSTNDGFSQYAVERLADLSADLYGFSTICSTYPLTVRVAQVLKQLRPTAKIVLGGPQASVVHRQTLEAFPWIDFILRGEADETFPVLLESFENGSGYHTIPGLTFRTDDKVVANPNAPAVSDLDRLPLPAFHLCDLSGCRYVPLELGRGCPFACKFCSTNDFFRRNFRLRSPESVLQQMRAVYSQYGVSTFDLVHDMFTVDRKRVVKFCQTMLKSGEPFFWKCSARTDCIDEDLIRLMARAGCRGIFFGIETGSPRMQLLVNKKLDLSEALSRVACTTRHRIRTVFSLITCFPEETDEDFRQTVGILIEALRYDYVEPQLHLLAPLGETPIHAQFRNQLVLDRNFSDMSYQSWEQHREDQQLIEAYPDIFPNFYAVPTLLDRAYVKRFRDFILYGTSRFRWLLVALADFTGDLIGVFDAWEQWLRARKNQGAPSPRYYAQVEFRRDFLEFCTEKFASSQDGKRTVVGALIEFEKLLDRLDIANATSSVDSGEGTVGREAVPKVAQDVRVARYPFNYLRIIRGLRCKKAAKNPRYHPVFIAVKASVADNRTETLQLTDAAAQLLLLCNGERKVDDIMKEYKVGTGSPDGISKEAECLFGLQYLCLQGLLSLRPGKARRASDTRNGVAGKPAGTLS